MSCIERLAHDELAHDEGIPMGDSRTARKLLTGAAAAVLALGMAGCGNDTDTADEPTVEEKVTEEADAPAASDGGGAATDPDAGGDDDQEGTVSDGGGDDAAGSDGEASGRPPAVMYIVDGVNDSVDTSQAAWTLAGGDLATILSNHDVISDRTAPSCDGDLQYTDGSSVNCTASFSLEGLDGEQELTVMAVRAPSGFDKAGAPALLVSIGATPSQEALDAFTDQDNQLVGLGHGSMFGSAELSAAELAEFVESTANSSQGPAVLDAPIAVDECEGPLPAASDKPVQCNAAWEHAPSENLDADAMGVWFVDSEPGLLVALEIGDQDVAGQDDED